MSFACLPISRVMLSSPGNASQLRLSHAELPPPAAGEIRVRHTAIGVNYVDIYHRDGLYPLPVWPSPLGVEAAGWVEALGPGVSHLHIGQRVAYAGPPVGSYSSARNLPAWLARWLGDSAEAALAWQRALWTALRPHWLQRPAHAPRIWRT